MNGFVIALIISVLGISLIRFATRFILKLVGIVIVISAVLVGMFHFAIGPFEQNPVSIQTLRSKYCVNEGDVKCRCIVEILESDLNDRWTEAELDYLRSNRTQMAYAMTKSFEAQKENIQTCLKTEGEEDALDEVMKDIIPIRANWKDRISTWTDTLAQHAENVLDSARGKKEWVDERYD